MEWFDIGAFIGGMIVGGIGFMFGWWARSVRSKQKETNIGKLPENPWPTGYYVTHPHFEPTHDAIEEYKDLLKLVNPHIHFVGLKKILAQIPDIEELKRNWNAIYEDAKIFAIEKAKREERERMGKIKNPWQHYANHQTNTKLRNKYIGFEAYRQALKEGKQDRGEIRKR